MVRLEAATTDAPPGLSQMLIDLGDGETGFGGPGIHSGKTTLEAYLQRCVDDTDSSRVPPHHVPQTTFWAIDDDGQAVGIVRLRHFLNDDLRIRGGHIGYYVRQDRRRRGYARRMLRLALAEARDLGVPRALLTVDARNIASTRVIETSGGVFDSETFDERSGWTSRRYWCDTGDTHPVARGLH